MADAWARLGGHEETGRRRQVTCGDLFGTRKHLKNNYLYRMAAAVLGIYGNSKEEAVYPTSTPSTPTGQPLDGAGHRYALRFAPGQLPPVNAFWSLTMYELPSQPADRQSAQPLPAQLADAAESEARRRRRPDDLCPARLARARTGTPTGCPRRMDRSCWCCVCTSPGPPRRTASGRRHHCSGRIDRLADDRSGRRRPVQGKRRRHDPIDAGAVPAPARRRCPSSAASPRAPSRTPRPRPPA